jgi:general secretion pathway protein G
MKLFLQRSFLLLLRTAIPLLTLQLICTMLFTATLLQTTNRKPQSAVRSPQSARGFTLIELLVVLIIIGILAGYVGPRILGHPEEAKRTMAAAQISSLETALESYKLDNGAYPSTEQGLQALVEAPSVGKLPPKWRKGGYMKKGKIPKDPWGNEYIYLSPGSHSDFDISSYGADHESGGEDADTDVNNWEIE